MKPLLVALFLALFSATAIAAPIGVDNGPTRVELGMGAYNLAGREGPVAGDFMAEVRPGLWYVKPIVGTAVNSLGMAIGYGGVTFDLRLFDKMVFSPFFAAAGISDNSLGGPFAYRMGAALAYELDNGWQMGLKCAHTSNNGQYDHNPGVEEMYMTLSIPLGVE